ncbi:hypothetical protein [Microbulbifer sp. TYP-18]|uniref:hypothetical protein n=1 Tax=Microbulbifer sp. TYP-18 TaxID=3230024 RepID=UPI0034C6B168
MRWHQLKDSYGPTFAGTRAWQQYMDLIETEARRLGVVDLKHNTFRYRRWHTSEWPDSSRWSLSIGGHPIEVANYGANSGTTGAAGVTADVVALTGDELSAMQDKSALRGKILVLSIRPTHLLERISDWLYAPPEYPFEVGQIVKSETSVFHSTVSQLFAANFDGSLPFPKPHYLRLIKETGAAAVVVIFDMANARVNGLYSFPVPAIYNIPTLYLGRESGRELLQYLPRHKQATLTLRAQIEETQAYQLAGFLPGRNYGTDKDEIVLMISHTDGPSISQENGPLGLLSILHYFAQFDARQRDKTLMLFLDSRHYIPNREAALPDYNIDRVLGPGGPLAPAKGKLVASVHLEHLGQLEYRELNGKYEPTGRMEIGGYYVTGYQGVIDLAEQALKDNHPLNQVLRSADIPGVHGLSQGPWFGLGHHPRKLGIEAIASNMTFMGAYWSSAARLDYLDVDQFIRQTNVMTQIAAGFMGADISRLTRTKLTETATEK